MPMPAFRSFAGREVNFEVTSRHLRRALFTSATGPTRTSRHVRFHTPCWGSRHQHVARMSHQRGDARLATRDMRGRTRGKAGYRFPPSLFELRRTGRSSGLRLLIIKPGETVELKLGGYHVMGLELRAPFASGQTAKGTLQFKKAGTVQVEYAVAPIGGSPQAGNQH
jgi:hypothetical protein